MNKNDPNKRKTASNTQEWAVPDKFQIQLSSTKGRKITNNSGNNMQDGTQRWRAVADGADASQLGGTETDGCESDEVTNEAKSGSKMNNCMMIPEIKVYQDETETYYLKERKCQ